MEKILHERFWLKTLPKLKRIYTISGCIELYETAQALQESSYCVFESEFDLLHLLIDLLEDGLTEGEYCEMHETGCFIAIDLLKEEMKKADTTPKVRRSKPWQK